MDIGKLIQKLRPDLRYLGQYYSRVQMGGKEGINMEYFTDQLISFIHKLLLTKVGVVGDKDLFPTLSIENVKDILEAITKARGEIKYAVLPQLPLEIAAVELTLKTHNQTEKVIKHNTEPNGKKEQQAVNSAPLKSDFWFKLLDTVKQDNFSVAGLLRSCHLKGMDDKNLIIETKYTFHKEKLEQENVRLLLEKACKDITGKTISVSIVLQ